MERAIRQNSSAQSTAALQKSFRTRRDGAVHPVTRTAFLRAMKTDALNFKILSDQLVKIDIARDHVPSNQRWRAILNLKVTTEFVENVERKKCNLPFVIVLEIEVTIAANSGPGHTFDHRNLNCRIRVRFTIVMADKIMAWRNVKMTDFHCGHDNIQPFK